MAAQAMLKAVTIAASCSYQRDVSADKMCVGSTRGGENVCLFAVATGGAWWCHLLLCILLAVCETCGALLKKALASAWYFRLPLYRRYSSRGRRWALYLPPVETYLRTAYFLLINYMQCLLRERPRRLSTTAAASAARAAASTLRPGGSSLAA